MITTSSDIVRAEANLRDAKRVAAHAYMCRTENLQLLRAKQTGRILAINHHTTELANLNKQLGTIMHDVKSNNVGKYVADMRVDDFLAHLTLEDKINKITTRIEVLEKTKDSAQELWDQQVRHLKPNHAGSLAVLNYVSGNSSENFLIDPERCKCGRLFHFNATLSMNFCPVHKVYYPVLSTDDKSNKKSKQSPGNYTNNSINTRHMGKAHRLVITSNNQICAANNVLYQSQLQHVQEHVAKSTSVLRSKLLKIEQVRQLNAPARSKKTKELKKPKKANEKRNIAAKTPRKTKSILKSQSQSNVAITDLSFEKISPPQLNVKNKKQTTIEGALTKQSQHSSVSRASKLQGEVESTFENQEKTQQDRGPLGNDCIQTGKRKIETTLNPCVKKKKHCLLINKNVSQYENYLLQFAPDAQEITSPMLQKIHNIASIFATFAETRFAQEITNLVETSDLFRDMRSHVERILKLSRGQPVPLISTDLRTILIQRFREVQNVLSEWQQAIDCDPLTKNRRRFTPCNEALTHIFLLSENECFVAGAFAAQSTLKVGLEQCLRFRELISTVATKSKFEWKCDFDLIVDSKNSRIPI